MSVLEFITSGGMASIGGDLAEDEREVVNSAIKQFAEKVGKVAISLQVPASFLKVRQSTFLFVGKDLFGYHIVFADAPGDNKLNYRDLTTHGRIDLQAIVHQVRIEIGDVIWAFTIPQRIPEDELSNYLDNIVTQYVNTVIQSQHTPEKKVSEEAIIAPEIASGVEKFKRDFPAGTKTSFIIMQFEDTKPHNEIVETIKETLKKYKIAALRADDKEYLDDLFPNAKVYIHSCDFGIAVFDRITEEDFNPNVSLEVGYMLGRGKNVLLLKDKTLKSLQTDLTGKLYKEFDPTDIKTSLPPQIEKWLKDKGII